jgi:hypothetical protein
MKFSVGCQITILGWVEVEADSKEEAKAKAKELNDKGVDTDLVQDADWSSEVFYDDDSEIEELKEGGMMGEVVKP